MRVAADTTTFGDKLYQLKEPELEFLVAHEFGHVFLQDWSTGLGTAPSVNWNYGVGSNEINADRFARDLLSLTANPTGVGKFNERPY
jgi:hypothetical protein